MTTYVALSHRIAVANHTTSPEIIENRLDSGDICFDLLRPVSFRKQIVLADVGGAAASVLMFGLPSFIVVAAVFTVVPPAGLFAAVSFVLLAFLGLVISYTIRYLIGLVGFVFIKASHISWFVDTIAGFLSGQIVPLWFYPQWLVSVARVTSFRLIFYAPFFFHSVRKLDQHIVNGTLDHIMTQPVNPLVNLVSRNCSWTYSSQIVLNAVVLVIGLRESGFTVTAA